MFRDIKLIAMDLDGTLLTSTKEVTENTRRVLKLCKEKGIKIAVATARPYRDVMRLCSGIELDAAVCDNGASIYIRSEKKHSSEIAPKQLQRIVRNYYKLYPEGQLIIESGDCLYFNKDIYPIGWEMVDYLVTDLLALEEVAASKLIFPSFKEEDCVLMRESLPEDIYILMGQNNQAMAMHRDASKSKGLSTAIKYFDLGLSHVMAFGDDNNDIDMLCAVGIGVAMGNAIAQVKECADYIALANNEDGIAKFLEDKILV